MSEKTLFQKISEREIPADIIFEDDLCFAFRDIEPQAPDHVLIVPKKPIPRTMDADQSDTELLGHLLYSSQKVAEILECKSTDKGYRLVINNGKDGGETVPHLHVHLLAGRKLNWPPG